MELTDGQSPDSAFISEWFQSSAFLILALGGGAILGAVCGGALAALIGTGLLVKAGGCIVGAVVGGIAGYSLAQSTPHTEKKKQL